MKTLKDWQKAAYELAVEKGWHHRECPSCKGQNRRTSFGPIVGCDNCNGTGRVPVDPHNPTRIASRLALIHCEISEAVECVARGKMELTWERGGDVIPDRVYQTRHTIQPWFDMSRESFVRRVEYIHDGGKPEGFPIELADVFLRLCDLAESLGCAMKHAPGLVLNGETDMRKVYRSAGANTPEAVSERLCYLHDYVPAAYFATAAYFAEVEPDTKTRELEWFLHELFAVATATSVDLLAMAELKHEYNKTRPIRHGGKVI